MTGLVTHFEIYGDDPANLSQFYATLFGWRIEKAPGIDYWRIQSEPTGSSAYGGGVTYRPADGPSSWLPYVTVDFGSMQRLLGRNAWAPAFCAPKQPFPGPVGTRSSLTLNETASLFGKRTKRHFHRPNRIDAGP